MSLSFGFRQMAKSSTAKLSISQKKKGSQKKNV